MRTQVINYTFNATTKAITFTDGAIPLVRILSVVNKTRGVTYYDPEDPALLGTVASNVLTLTGVSTTGHADADTLEIWKEVDSVEAAIATSLNNLSSNAATEGTLQQVRNTLEFIDGKADALELIASDTRDLVAAQSAALQSNRQKVSPIVGQDGVDAGAGNVSALTQRVVLATDVALPAGNNAIGKLAANSGVDIGDVDVTSVIPGTGATNLGKSDNAAHSNGDVGVMGLGVRNDLPTVHADSDLDYSPMAMDKFGNSRMRGAIIPTYMAATATFTPAASPTDVFNITGSSTKTVKVLRIIVCGTQTTTGNVGTISVIKRSTANSGGTAVSATAVPTDSNFGAATASVRHYTANPTVGTAVGTVWNPRTFIPSPAAAQSNPIATDMNFQDLLNGTGLVLNGTAESLSVNMGAALPSGAANFQVTCIWTEE